MDVVRGLEWSLTQMPPSAEHGQLKSISAKGRLPEEDNKAAKQAWRRNPRQFASKSRLGCKTCKIRRIKCDLSRPSCLKCKSTGRTCDGYGESRSPLEIEAESNRVHKQNPNGAESQHRYKREQSYEHAPVLSARNLRPFMVLPATGSAQLEALNFFESISIRELNEYQPCESWRKTLMFFSQTVPSVRHAALALALLHRSYLEGNPSTFGSNPQSLNGSRIRDNVPLLYYTQAIHFLLNQDISNDGVEKTAISLLVCYLFTCFDHLSGNDVQAMKHLSSGVELSRNIETAILDGYQSNDNLSGDSGLSGICTLTSQVTRQIRRLDRQAVMFAVDWTPDDVQETLMFQLPPSGSAFRSFEQAADHLQVLIVQVMKLRNLEEQMEFSAKNQSPSLPFTLKHEILGRMEMWSSLFENMLQQSDLSSDKMAPQTDSFTTLLRLQHKIAWTFLSSYGSGREMDYDDFLPEFKQCVALAGDFAAAHETYAGSLKPTFTPEIGILPMLYLVGAKCRHPVVRRQVLTILRRQPMREAVWDSICTARVIERIIDIEERGSKGGQSIQSMEDIAIGQRIEALSWVRVATGPSMARLDITYTLCMQEGVHIESVMV